jgi:CrcB protein
MLLVGVAVAGALGAPLRYILDGVVQARSESVFPFGTFVVNVTGSLILGVLTGLFLYHAFPMAPKIVLGTGFCGAYTTFSTFAYETVRLVEEHAFRQAFLNVMSSMLVPAAAAAGGLIFASA